MDKSKIATRFEEELSNSSDHVKKSRLFYCKMFLDFAPEDFSQWNKGLVNNFLKRLRGEGYSPGSTRNIYSITKRVFDAAKAVHESERTRLISEVNPSDSSAVAEILKAISLPGPSWDMGKRGAPRVESSDVVKPSLTLEEIGAMVEAVKHGLLEPPEVAYLALASVYGLRREELVRIRPEHIDYKKKTIFVLTAKGGEQRSQLLCDEVIPHLKAYDFQDTPSLFEMSKMYWRIEHKAGLVHKDGGGWHQFRRALDTELVDECNRLNQAPGELYAHFFLRWRLSSSMVEHYYSRSPLEIDARVLSVHPVVALWR